MKRAISLLALVCALVAIVPDTAGFFRDLLPGTGLLVELRAWASALAIELGAAVLVAYHRELRGCHVFIQALAVAAVIALAVGNIYASSRHVTGLALGQAQAVERVALVFDRQVEALSKSLAASQLAEDRFYQLGQKANLAKASAQRAEVQSELSAALKERPASGRVAKMQASGSDIGFVFAGRSGIQILIYLLSFLIGLKSVNTTVRPSEDRWPPINQSTPMKPQNPTDGPVRGADGKFKKRNEE